MNYREFGKTGEKISAFGFGKTAQNLQAEVPDATVVEGDMLNGVTDFDKYVNL